MFFLIHVVTNLRQKEKKTPQTHEDSSVWHFIQVDQNREL